MVDPEYANRVLAQDAPFQELLRQFNGLGIFRFFVFVVAAIWAIATGINQQMGLLIIGLVVSFIIVMIVNYQRMKVRVRQQARLLQLGLITEDDLR